MPTRKDFRKIAADLASIENRQTRINKAVDAAAIFSALNPRFDRRIFFKACGLKPSEVGMFSGLWSVE